MPNGNNIGAISVAQHWLEVTAYLEILAALQHRLAAGFAPATGSFAGESASACEVSACFGIWMFGQAHNFAILSSSSIFANGSSTQLPGQSAPASLRAISYVLGSGPPPSWCEVFIPDVGYVNARKCRPDLNKRMQDSGPSGA